MRGVHAAIEQGGAQGFATSDHVPVRHELDVPTFVAALDRRREECGLSWREVAEKTGTSPSTLTRMKQGKRPDVDTFASLSIWLGIPPFRFFNQV